MKLSGRIHEVTNLQQFALSYIANSKKPKAGTFKTVSGIKIHLSSAIPGFGGFFPSLSVNASSRNDGRFEINVSDTQLKQLKSNKLVYLVAYRNAGSVKVFGNNVIIWEPVYRCQAFDITKYKSASHDIYFAPYPISNENGITQAQIDEQIAAAKKKFKDIKSLSGNINEGGVRVKGSGRGAEIEFNVDLSPSTSFDLNRFIRGKVKSVDIDLPGPDFIVGICVSKDDLEKEVENKIAELMKDVNKEIKATLINEVSKQTGQSKTIIQSLFDSMASLTFSRLSYPTVGTKKMKVLNQTFDIPVRAVVPRLSLGFPRSML